MTDDAFEFEQTRPIDALRRLAASGNITPVEAVDMAYGAGYAAGILSQQELESAPRIVRVGNVSTPEVQS